MSGAVSTLQDFPWEESIQAVKDSLRPPLLEQILTNVASLYSPRYGYRASFDPDLGRRWADLHPLGCWCQTARPSKRSSLWGLDQPVGLCSLGPALRAPGGAGGEAGTEACPNGGNGH